MSQQQHPFAIVLCKFSDAADEPFPRQYYENLFTTAGTGLNNMVDFFRHFSHGRVDIGGSEVFGWFDLPHPRAEYRGSGANPSGRTQLLQWVREAASSNGVPLGEFANVVACMNVPTDLFGTVEGVVTPSGNMPLDMSPSMLAQEMLHTFGLGHSGDDATPDQQYADPWDAMSTAVWPSLASDPTFFRIGPGLNAANMSGLGWLDPGRVWTRSDSFDDTVVLRPHHRRDLAGPLVAVVGPYFVEFRMNDGWDAAIGRPAVLVHRYEGNRSFVMAGTNGSRDLVAGATFRRLDDSPLAIEHSVRVEAIDTAARTATVRLTRGPTIPAVSVPDVFESLQADAATIIRDAGLVPRFTGRRGSGAWVIHQTPRAETLVALGSTVTCELQTGTRP